MHIDLQTLDSGPISIDLPPAGPDGKRDQSARIQRLDGLRGTLTQSDGSLGLSGVSADRASLDALVLWFGKVEVAAAAGALLTGAAVGFERDRAGVDFELDVQALETSLLQIGLPTLTVEAAARLEPAALRVHGSAGSVRAPRPKLDRFRLTLPKLEVFAERITAESLTVEWKPGGFYLQAEGVTAVGLSLVATGTTVRAASARAASFTITDGDIALGELEVTEAVVEVDLPRAPVHVGETEEPPSAASEAPRAGDAPAEAALQETPLMDRLLLDKISGTVGVDADVDVSLPVIGHRRATHELRLHLQDGTLDFRELERGLARLEDSLLDFSVRDGELVLELGLPVIPTRGHGRPLLRWPLPESERDLAGRNRVRIATLLDPRSRGRAEGDRASTPPPSEGEEKAKRKKVDLRELVLRNIRVDVVLPAPDRPLPAHLRSLCWDALRAKGSIHHKPTDGAERPPDGKIETEVDGLFLDLRDLPMGDRHLDVCALRVHQISRCETAFEGLRPRQLFVALDVASSDAIAFGERRNRAA